jgi:hypothetical protein
MPQLKPAFFYLISEPVFIHMGISLTPDVIFSSISCQLWRISDSETFYIERNNTMLHIKLLNGTKCFIVIFLI